jgi:hypothetical protein
MKKFKITSVAAIAGILLLLGVFNSSAQTQVKESINYLMPVNWYSGTDSITIKVLISKYPTNKTEFNEAILELKRIKFANNDEKYLFEAVMKRYIGEVKTIDQKRKIFDVVDIGNIMLQNSFKKKYSDFNKVLMDRYKEIFSK